MTETDDIDVHQRFRDALDDLSWYSGPVPEDILDQTLYSDLPGKSVRRHEIEDAREQLIADPDVMVTEQDSPRPKYEFRDDNESRGEITSNPPVYEFRGSSE